MKKIFGFALAFAISGPVFSYAASCEQQSISGRYIPTQMLSETNKSYRSQAILDMEQRGCELRVKPSVVETILTYVSKGTVTSKTKTNSGGVWKFDLTGKNKAVIPQEYINANSNDPTSAKMTKSLEMYTTMQPDGKILLKTIFEVEHAGAVVKMSAESAISFYLTEFTNGGDSKKYSGMMSLDYPGVKFRVLPSKGEARNLVIESGANWLLEAFEPLINNAIGVSGMSFMRK